MRFRLVVLSISMLALAAGQASAGARTETKTYLGESPATSFVGLSAPGACVVVDADSCFGDVRFSLGATDTRFGFAVQDGSGKVVGGTYYLLDAEGAFVMGSNHNFCGSVADAPVLREAAGGTLAVSLQAAAALLYACPYRTPSAVTSGTVTATFQTTP